MRKVVVFDDAWGACGPTPRGRRPGVPEAYDPGRFRALGAVRGRGPSLVSFGPFRRKTDGSWVVKTIENKIPLAVWVPSPRPQNPLGATDITALSFGLRPSE